MDSDNDIHGSTKQLALDAVGIMYKPYDAFCLGSSELLDKLLKLVSDDTDADALSSSARSIYCIVSSACLAWNISGSYPFCQHASQAVGAIQKELLTKIKFHVRRTITHWSPGIQISKPAHAGTCQGVVSRFRDDTTIYEPLTVLYRWRSSAAGRRLGPTSMFWELPHYVRESSLRVMRLGLRLMRSEVTHSKSSAFEPMETDSDGDNEMEPVNKEKYIADWLDDVHLLLNIQYPSRDLHTSNGNDIDELKSKKEKTNGHITSDSATLSSTQYELHVHNTDSAVSPRSFVSHLLNANKDIFAKCLKAADLRRVLQPQGRYNDFAVLMTGSRDECLKMGRSISRRGFCVSILLKPTDDGYAKNQKLLPLNPSSWTSSYTSFCKISEIISMIRFLASFDDWREVIRSQLKHRLQKLPTVTRICNNYANGAEMNQSDLKVLGHTLAALAVLGGFQEVIRIGGTVQFVDSGVLTRGTVVSYERGRKDILVAVNNRQRPFSIEASRVRAVSEKLVGDLWSEVDVSEILRFIMARQKSRETVDRVCNPSEFFLVQTELYSLRSLCELLKNKAQADKFVQNADFLKVLTILSKRCSPAANMNKLESQNLRSLERMLDLIRSNASAPVPSTSSSSQKADQDWERILPALPSCYLTDGLPTKLQRDNCVYSIFEDEHMRTVEYTRPSNPQSSLGRPQRLREFPNLPHLEGFMRTSRVGDSLKGDFIVYGDRPVPEASSEFYFEVEILTTNPISIGLAPKVAPSSVVSGSLARESEGGRNSSPNQWSGFKLKCPTWCDGSYRFEGKSGKVIKRTEGTDVSENYSSEYSRKGEIIGCGWSKSDGSIYFTRNGKHLGVAFDCLAVESDDMTLYPVIGFCMPGSRVCINFGQNAFSYNLPKTPKRETAAEKRKRQQRAAELEKKARAQEEQEKQRRMVEQVARDAHQKEMAQMILGTCGPMVNNDERLALKALEMHYGDANAVVSWLLDTPGAQARLSMAIEEEDAMKALEQARQERQEAAVEKEKKSTPKEECQKGKSTKSNNTRNKRENTQGFEFDSSYMNTLVLEKSYKLNHREDELTGPDPVEQEWLLEIETLLRAKGLDPQLIITIMSELRMGGAARANAILMLTDVLPNVPPFRKSDPGASALQHPVLREEDLKIGLRVLIADNKDTDFASSSSQSTASKSIWLPCMNEIRNRIAIIVEIDYTRSLVKVCLDQPETSSVVRWWVPSDVLRKVQTNSMDAFIGLETINNICSESVLDDMSNLACLYARKAIIRVLDHHPQHIASMMPSLRKKKDKSQEASELLYLLLREDLQPVMIQQQPSQPLVEDVCHQLLLKSPTLLEDMLEDCAAFIVDNAISIDTDDNAALLEGGELQLVKVQDACALALTFSRTCLLPSKEHVLQIFSDSSATQLVKRYVGGSRKQASPLDPVLVNSNCAWLQATKDSPKTSHIQVQVISCFCLLVCLAQLCIPHVSGYFSKRTTPYNFILLQVTPVPAAFSICCWILHFIISKATGWGTSTDIDSSKRKNTWGKLLASGLGSLGKFLCTPLLSPILSCTLLRLLTRGLHAWDKVPKQVWLLYLQES